MDFVAGCIGGCAGVLVGHPFDTVKVRMQTQNACNPQYMNTVHCFRSIIRQESVFGLFRGMASPMVGVSAVNALVFGVYGAAQKCFEDRESLTTHLWAGAAAGTVQSVISGPMELVKTRLQIQQGKPSPATCATKDNTRQAAMEPHRRQRHYSGPVDCVRQILKREGGIVGLTRGLGATLARDAPAFAAYFASYEYFVRSPLLSKPSNSNQRIFYNYQQSSNSSSSGCREPASVEQNRRNAQFVTRSHVAPECDKGRQQPHRTTSPTAILVAGGLAGVVSWVVVYPVDVIKSRIQSEPSSASDHSLALRTGKHHLPTADPAAGRLLRVGCHLYTSEGVRGLFRGLNSAILRAFPTNAATFVGVEAVLALHQRYVTFRESHRLQQQQLHTQLHQVAPSWVLAAEQPLALQHQQQVDAHAKLARKAGRRPPPASQHSLPHYYHYIAERMHLHTISNHHH